MRGRLSIGVVLLTVALAAIAIGGTGSASASKFCETNNGPPCTTPYTLGTVLDLEQTSALASFSPTPPTLGVSASCAHSSAEMKYETAGAPAQGKVLAFNFSSCTGCKSVTTSGLPWGMQAEARGGGNGAFYIDGLMNFTFSECSETKITCEYHQEEIESEFGGGAPAVTELASTLLLRSGGTGCAKTLVWAPTAYKFSSPSPLYLR